MPELRGEVTFEPGQEVKLVGLSSPALNGLRCIVVDEMNAKGRYPVQLPVSDSVFFPSFPPHLKPAH